MQEMTSLSRASVDSQLHREVTSRSFALEPRTTNESLQETCIFVPDDALNGITFSSTTLPSSTRFLLPSCYNASSTSSFTFVTLTNMILDNIIRRFSTTSLERLTLQHCTINGPWIDDAQQHFNWRALFAALPRLDAVHISDCNLRGPLPAQFDGTTFVVRYSPY